MTVFVVLVDDAYQLEPLPPAVFAEPHQAEQYARDQAGATATRAVVARDNVQYVNACGDRFIRNPSSVLRHAVTIPSV